MNLVPLSSRTILNAIRRGDKVAPHETARAMFISVLTSIRNHHIAGAPLARRFAQRMQDGEELKVLARELLHIDREGE